VKISERSFVNGLQPCVISCQPFELCFFFALPNFANCQHAINSTFDTYLINYEEG